MWYVHINVIAESVNNVIELTLSAFFTAAGMAFFHGVEYLEKQKITGPEFTKSWIDTDVSNIYS